MLEKRNPIYRSAHSSFITDGKDPKQVAIEILEAIKKNRPVDLV
jgi:shikimate kinase